MRDLDDDVRWPDAARRPDRADTRDARTVTPGRVLPHGSRREQFDVRERSYRLRHSEVEVLRTLGRFGPTRVEDLDMARPGDLRGLDQQGLIARTAATERERRAGREIAALSTEGRRLLEEAEPDRGPYREGFGRRRELPHDALVYRAYRDAAATIERSGGQVRNVASDGELKHAVYARPRGDERDLDPEVLRQTRAEALGLRLDEDGRVQFPDLHITYEDRDGHQQHLGVDVVTESYKAHHIAAKMRAGFHLFHAPRNARARGGIQHERAAHDLFER